MERAHIDASQHHGKAGGVLTDVTPCSAAVVDNLGHRKLKILVATAQYLYTVAVKDFGALLYKACRQVSWP